MSRFFISTFIFVFLIGLFPVQAFADEELPESKVILTEIRLGGAEIELEESAYKEYVTLFNNSSEEINLEGWKVEYAKNDFEAGFCDLPDWSSASDGYKTELEGLTLLPNGVLSIERQLNDTGSGSLRVVEDTAEQTVIHDLVGWGENPPCFESSQAPLPSDGDSLQRYIDCESSLPIDTNDNFADFALSVTPTPGELSGLLINCPDSDQDDDEGGVGGGSDNPNQNSCDGIIITEILPNPSGPDAGNEFIELYNPTSGTISLKDCRLETTANSKIYTFEDTELKPKQYQAFYNDITGLTLANSSGGSVYLVDTDNSELEVEYQPDLDDDIAWALDISDKTWSITYTPTPGAKNEIVEVKPCPEGQFRNLDTNRCNKIAVETSLGPCPTGKFRNPETNRCKNILDASSQLKPCNPGQFRNPETNRCKKNGTSSLKPCDSDQERNPETNRCRKIASSTATRDNQVKDVLSVSQAQDQTSWAMAGFSFAGATAYAVWEWRREMLEKLLAIKSKLGLK